MAGPAYHGRTHLPGGTDPIPFFGGGAGFSHPLYLPVLEASAMNASVEKSGTVTWAQDAAFPMNGYMEMNADGAWFSWLVMLGPQNSYWSHVPRIAVGPDYGKVTWDLASVPTDGVDGTYAIPDELLADEDSLTWVELGPLQDLYAPAEDAFSTWGNWEAFRISGGPGDVGSAFATDPDGFTTWDGGPGPHRFRIRVDGQNALSTGFKFRLSSLMFVRVDELGHI